MGVVLYKPGTKYKINGWLCDKHVFDPEYLNLDARLKEGWHLKPSCGREKDNGVQQEKIKPKHEKKSKEPKEAPELPEEITEQWLYTLEYHDLRRVIRKLGLSISNCKKPLLIQRILKGIGEQNDVQDRPDQQSIQPVEDQRGDDDKPESGGDGLSS